MHVSRPEEVPRPSVCAVNRDLRRDLYAAASAALLVVTAVVIGTGIEHRNGSLRVGWPPLLATWEPHIGPGTPAAIAVAVAVVAYGPALAARLPWRPLLLVTWGTALAWTWSLALVDGWYRGIAQQLTTRYEYLQVIGRFHDIPGTLRDFTHHIIGGTPGSWPAHVAGHPPGATVTFVLLDRIGLGGGGWAGTFVITVGTTATVAVLVAVRTLADEKLARRAAPFLALAPAAVWVGTSADGYFTAVAAWATAFLALAVTGHHPRWTGFAAGLLFGLTAYLSYGLTLFALIAAAVLLLGSQRTRPLPFLLAGLAVIPAVFTALGFNWWEAYHLLVTRYYQGAGGVRPYGYWVWANLACTVFIVGPATAAGLCRTGTTLIRRPPAPAFRLAVLVAAALLALLVADASGMSKAETERIWLPFAMWLLPSCAFLTGARGWLAAQAVLALLVNHLLLTGW
ncbi:glycosyltransferase family 39 protein [Streptomyces coacervatus]|uniref:Glycosyltransferase family 39 protein n=1 Tax=Streptomyces coacervatus TaxID=647381 RepID=A0ABP7H6Y8_9ACTN|nr:hypothetical protein [Streptomyces coacervatus]MDF2267533.1 hypothetical protein [Streptomyces coacervatus]